MSRETHPRDHSLPPEALLSLIPVRDAEELGVHAIAQMKLHAPDSLFVAYLAGFDGADTLWGLISAGEMALGRLYVSGLTVAWSVWGIPIQHDPQFKPVSLQHLMQTQASM